MIAMQKNNFDEVNVMINNVTIKTTTIGEGGYHYRTDADRSYRWDELPDRYVEMISKRYRSHSNYDNIISYADMIQYLVENYHDIEVDSHGKLNIRVPFREKLRDYAGDIVISYDDNGLVLNCESKDYGDLFNIKFSDISEIISKAEAYDRLKESVESFVTKV